MKRAITTLFILLATLADAGVVCDEPVFKFGSLTTLKPVHHRFVLRNAGDKAAHIDKLQVGCGCTSLKAESRTIEPGESTVIQMVFTPKGKYGEQNISGFVRISKPSNQLIRLKMTGRLPTKGEPRFTASGGIVLSSKRIQFGQVICGFSAQSQLKISDSEQKVIAIQEVRSDIPTMHVIFSKQPAQSPTLSLRLKANMEGSVMGQLRIVLADKREARVDVRASVVPDLLASPRVASFKSHTIGSYFISVNARSKKAFTIKNMAVPEGVTVDQAATNASSRHRLRIRLDRPLNEIEGREVILSTALGKLTIPLQLD